MTVATPVGATPTAPVDEVVDPIRRLMAEPG